jgi:CheY-like chemotaxis protein
MTKRVLLCDDEIHILRAAEFKLAAAGYEVLCAFSGREAWDLVQERIPDLVVTDFQMPEMNGIELIERLRGDANTAHLPIIMLTAKGLEVAREEVQRLGLVKILTKPFSPRALLQLIDETLSAAGVAV